MTQQPDEQLENPAEGPSATDQTQRDQADESVTQQPPQNDAQDVLHDTDTEA